MPRDDDPDDPGLWAWRLIWRIVFVAVGITFGLPVLAFAAIVFIGLTHRVEYDRAHSDYARFDPVLGDIRQRLGKSPPAADEVLDLGPLNDGDWTTACVFGGYNNPVSHIEKLGAVIDERDRKRLTERGRGLLPPNPLEFLIAYVDSANRAHFVHFEQGIGANGQHLLRCIAKPDTKVVVAQP